MVEGGTKGGKRVWMIAVVAVYAVAVATGLRHAFGPTGRVGWYHTWQHGRLYASPIDSRLRYLGLEPRSRLLELNGVDMTAATPRDVAALLHTAGDGDVWNYLVIEDEDDREVHISARVQPLRWSDVLAFQGTRLLLGVLLVAAGIVSFEVRPSSQGAWAVLVFNTILAGNLLLNNLIFPPNPSIDFVVVYEALLSACIPVAGVHVALAFPVASRWLQTHARRNVLLLYVVAGAPLGWYALRMRMEGKQKWELLSLLAIGAIVAMAGHALWLAIRQRGTLVQQRAVVLLAGIVIGLLPTAVVISLQNFLGMTELELSTTLWTMFAFPLALVYLAIRREPVDARIAGRRAAAFALAAVAWAVVAVIVAQVLRLLFAPQRDGPTDWMIVCGVIGATIPGMLLWPRYAALMDQVFYPKRALIPSLSKQFRTRLAECETREAVLDVLVRAPEQLAEAVNTTAFLFGTNADWKQLYRSTLTTKPLDTLVLAQTVLIRRLVETRRPIWRSLLSRDPDLLPVRGLCDTVFNRLAAEAVWPLVVKEQTVGVFAVGPRLSGDEYEVPELDALTDLVAAAGEALTRLNGSREPAGSAPSD